MNSNYLPVFFLGGKRPGKSRFGCFHEQFILLVLLVHDERLLFNDLKLKKRKFQHAELQIRIAC